MARLSILMEIQSLGSSALPVVGAQGAAHGVEEAPQDAVLVEGRHAFQRAGDLGFERLELLLAGIGRRLAQRRIEARQEEIDHQSRDRRIGRQHALHVVLAEGDAGLPQILGVGAQDRDLAPGQPGAQHQPIEPVAFQRARPYLVERLGEARACVGEIDRRLVGGLDAQHLQRHRLVARLEQERRLAQHAQPEVFRQRQDVGQRERRLGMEQSQREAMHRQIGRAVEPHAERPAGQGGLHQVEVGHGLVGIEAVAIDGGEPVAPAAGGGAALGLAQRLLQGGAEAVAPRGRGFGERPLELGEIGRRRVVGLELQRVEHLGQRRIAADRDVDRLDLALPGRARGWRRNGR